MKRMKYIREDASKTGRIASGSRRLAESHETTYLEADEALELMDQGMEVRGRGRYTSYRFSKRPGSDIVTFWHLDHNEDWDNGDWTVDEFLKNMSSFGGTKMLYVDERLPLPESKRPGRKADSGKRLDESIDYGSLTQRDQLKMDRLVKNLQGAKETLESLCYRGDVEDDVTRGELLEMHMAVRKMLDRLPW